jgi:hypothetical protein
VKPGAVIEGGRFLLRVIWLLLSSRLRFLLLLGTLVLVVRYYEHRSSATPDWKLKGPTPSKVAVVRVPEGEHKSEIVQKTVRFLEQEKYEELEQLAASLRSSKAMDAFGVWDLNIFYEALSELPVSAPDSEWDARLARLDAWVQKTPDTPTARIALAYAWIEFAWKARGTGSGSSVTDPTWQVFLERMHRGHEVLRAVPHPIFCPVYYYLLHRVALIEDWPRSKVDDLFQESVRVEPAYTHFYLARINYLLPRWRGREGEWQAFAAETADKIGGDDGSILYARMVWYLWKYPVVQQNQFFNRYPETRQRAMKGLAVIHKRFPDSLNFTSHYCNFAATMEYLALTRTLMSKIDGRVDLSVWGGQSRFVDCYKWAHY